MGIVQWEDDWYAVGTAFPIITGYENVQINENEKYIFKIVETQIGIVKRQEESFLEVNNNKRILILDNKRDAFIFIDKVWELYHLKYGIDTIDRKLFDVHGLTFDVNDDLENLTLFFNPCSGLEFYPNIAQCIILPDNKYFNKNAEADIEDLILDEKISSDFILFLIENKMIEIESLHNGSGFNYIWNNCDFLLRYWKKERYIPEPKLFVD